ncbi:hypothetical protein N656DRAFT_734046, partial [Canariomyces notabilis]
MAPFTVQFARRGMAVNPSALRHSAGITDTAGLLSQGAARWRDISSPVVAAPPLYSTTPLADRSRRSGFPV